MAQKPRRWFDWASPWLLLLSILIANARTPAVVALFLIFFLAIHLPVSKKLKVLSAAGLGLSALGLVWAFLSQKFLLQVDFSSGRAEGWIYLFSNLPEDVNLWGQGGGLSSFLINQVLGYHHPHNEYLRIFFDFGLTGFFLFLAGAIVLWSATMQIHRQYTTDASFAPVLLLPAVGLIAITDNPLIFIYVMLPTAIVIAASLSKSLPSLVNPKANRETKSAQ